MECGDGNNFGHPNKKVLERLKKYGAVIYRTDISGEITIRVNKKGKIWLDEQIYIKNYK